MPYELLTLHPKWETEFINLSKEIQEFVLRHKIVNEILLVKVQDSTSGLMIRQFEEGFLNDYLRHAETMVPKTSYYEHDDTSKHKCSEPDGRKNGWSHIRAAIYSQPFVIIPVVNGKIVLGEDEAVIYSDWDGQGRIERKLLISTFTDIVE